MLKREAVLDYSRDRADECFGPMKSRYIGKAFAAGERPPPPASQKPSIDPTSASRMSVMRDPPTARGLPPPAHHQEQRCLQFIVFDRYPVSMMFRDAANPAKRRPQRLRALPFLGINRYKSPCRSCGPKGLCSTSRSEASSGLVRWRWRRDRPRSPQVLSTRDRGEFVDSGTTDLPECGHFAVPDHRRRQRPPSAFQAFSGLNTAIRKRLGREEGRGKSSRQWAFAAPQGVVERSGERHVAGVLADDDLASIFSTGEKK